jgi:hypothetical protein
MAFAEIRVLVTSFKLAFCIEGQMSLDISTDKIPRLAVHEKKLPGLMVALEDGQGGSGTKSGPNWPFILS